MPKIITYLALKLFAFFAAVNLILDAAFWISVWLVRTVTCRTCNPEVTQGRRFDSAPGHCRVTTLGKLFTHMCFCHRVVAGQRVVMPRGWEGNRRSGVALAMRHGLSGLSTYGLNGHRKGDEHPPTPQFGYGTFTFIFSDFEALYKPLMSCCTKWTFKCCNAPWRDSHKPENVSQSLACVCHFL